MARNSDQTRKTTTVVNGLFSLLSSPVPHLRYTPVDSVLTINTDLSAGGAERLLVDFVLEVKSRTQIHTSLSVAVPMYARGDHDRFYESRLAAAGLETREYFRPGSFKALADTLDSDIVLLLSQLGSFLRDEIASLVDLYRRVRPKSTLVLQHSRFPAAALAGLMVGVKTMVFYGLNLNPRRHTTKNPEEIALWRDVYRAIATLPNVVLCNNSQAGARDCEDWSGLPTGTIRHLANGLRFPPVDRDKGLSARGVLGVGGDDYLVGGVFRFTAVKRPLRWLETAAGISQKLAATRFVVFGDGPLHAEAEAKAEVLGLGSTVQFMGIKHDIHKWMSAFDLLLMTSSAEGQSNAIIEAQALGIPVVATAVGGNSEVVKHGITGWLVDDHDHRKLIECACTALTDTRWRRDVQRIAPELMRRKFAIERYVDTLVDLLM